MRTHSTQARHASISIALLIVLLSTATADAQTLEAFTEPSETVRVASPEAGIIASVELSEGDRVSAGQLIATLDTKILEASLASARAIAESRGSLASANATLNLRRIRHEKIKRLHDDGHASPEEAERAASDLAVAEAELISIREKIDQSRLEVKRIEAQIERRKIRSPIDGVIIRLEKKPGELVAAGDSLVATVVQLSELRVRFYLPTPQAIKLKRNDQVKVFLPQTDQTTSGSVDFVSPVTDSDSGTVRVEVVIKNTKNEYRSGLRCILANSIPVSLQP